jgi:mono/diheme cytochrome c family protein
MRAILPLACVAAAAVLAVSARGTAPAHTADIARNGRSPSTNYKLDCQGCHLPDGSGLAGSVPSIKGELVRFLSVEGGRAFLIQVPGSANSKLSDADLADLMNWLLIAKGGATAGSFKEYTADEVAAYRASRLVDVNGVRAQLVKGFVP